MQRLALKMPRTIEVCIRPMRVADIASVLKIEEASFRFAWTHAAFATALRTAGFSSFVADAEGTVLGFAIVRAMGRDDGQHGVSLDNIAVSPACRRRGIGRALVSVAKQAAGSLLIKTVCELDAPAIGFLRACDFRAVRVVRGLYSGDGDDGPRGDTGAAGNRDGYQFAWKLSAEGRS